MSGNPSSERSGRTIVRPHEGGYVAEGPGFYVWDEDPAEVLRAGLPYWYEPSPVLKNYVALTRSVLESVGDAALAGELRRRYNGSVGEGER